MGTRPNVPTDFARWTVSASVFLVVLALPALALNPAYQISQYAHTSWRADAGIQTVRRIKQTPDGYLWLATRVGLVRFDGVRFTTFKAGSEKGLESSTTQDLVIDPDGSVWVATLGGGVAHYQAGKFHTYTVKDGLPSDEIGALYRDSRGTLWVGTRGAGIARRVNGQFEKLPLAVPPGRISAFLEGPDHSLWISILGYGVFRLQNGILTPFAVHDGIPDDRVIGLYLDPTGRIWTAGYKGISFWNGTRFVAYTAVNAVVGGSEVISCTEDREGNLWIASSSGLFRAHGEEVSRMDRSAGLSGDFVSDVYEDREGNIWAGTRAGLDRFRRSEVRLFRQPNGPIVADNRGVWTASNQKITRIAANTARAWPLSLPADSTVHSLLSKLNDGFLIGFDEGVRGWTSGPTHLAAELSGLNVLSLLRAHDGSIWIGTANRGLLRWAPSAGSRSLAETGVADSFITTLAEDRSGAVWAGSSQGGGLYRLSGENVQHFGPDEGLSPEIYTVFVDGNGQLWIGSVGGLSWFQDGRIRTVNSQQGLPADQVFAILDDSYDRLWFTEFAGISSIDKRSLTDWAAGRRHNVIPILYPNAEGIQPRTSGFVFPNTARTRDGHLWFSIADGLAEVTPPEPAAALSSEFRVIVEDATIDHVPHFEPDRIRIPPGEHSMEIRYTALTLTSPETIRFRYQLEGFDKDWIDADVRRIAYYNNLKPGSYTFRVEASAEEDRWLKATPLLLEQLPFFYQATWFRLTCIASFLVLLWALYELRVRQLARQFNMTLEARVNERTRIARDLHDTLLQSFHGLMLRFQAAYNQMAARPEEARETLGSAIEEAAEAITEGRDAIQGLRLSTVETNDLALAVRTLGESLAADSTTPNSPAFRVGVEGTARDLHPILRDEVYRIAGEALRNAFKHAQAHEIEVEIRYDDPGLRLRVRDDGKGIDPKVLNEDGRAGHYGLSGMRERAKLMRGKLTVWSELDSGTEVELNIPASTAYAKSPARRSWFAGWRK